MGIIHNNLDCKCEGKDEQNMEVKTDNLKNGSKYPVSEPSG
jgi:hypothetical protein